MARWPGRAVVVFFKGEKFDGLKPPYTFFTLCWFCCLSKVTKIHTVQPMGQRLGKWSLLWLEFSQMLLRFIEQSTFPKYRLVAEDKRQTINTPKPVRFHLIGRELKPLFQYPRITCYITCCTTRESRAAATPCWFFEFWKRRYRWIFLCYQFRVLIVVVIFW